MQLRGPPQEVRRLQSGPELRRGDVSEFDRFVQETRTDKARPTRRAPPRRRRDSFQIIGEWTIAAGGLMLVVGLIAHVLASAQAARVWNIFGDPHLVSAGVGPAADYSILLVSLAGAGGSPPGFHRRVGAGIGLALFGALILAVRRQVGPLDRE